MFRKVARMCDKAADACAKGAEYCEQQKVSAKELLEAYSVPEVRNKINGVYAEYKQQQKDEGDDEATTPDADVEMESLNLNEAEAT